MKYLNKLVAGATTAGLILSSTLPIFAQGAQVFDVYNNTQDGLQADVDPDSGNVVLNANPGGTNRLVFEVHAQKLAPSCEFSVELVRGDETLNGGLDGTGHTGSVQILGTLTTNKAGNGNAHFDVEVGDGVLDTEAYGHIDLEPVGACTDFDGNSVGFNQFGAAPDPLLLTPATWMG